ncbi:MAG: 16S rRNA (guanine(527)-N(7))-methyltransferase RsmG [Salibacteraceae bacterium]
MDLINKYFPELTETQKDQFDALLPLYKEWNQQINVISRKDIDELYERHVLHSLAIAKFIQFVPNTTVLDVGTGGGFPGIPLAIMFPECQFTLIDSIGKKIKVVNAVSDNLGLKNCNGEHINAKLLTKRYDFVVSRAVTNFKDFLSLVKKNISQKQFNKKPNGVIYLKGGDLTEELAFVSDRIQTTEIKKYFDYPFFDEKVIIHYY